MTLDQLDTPCLVLDRTILARNIAAAQAAADTLGTALRPHLKTAKSIDAARMALAAGARGITVSTIAEAEYFARHGIDDMTYAAGITPRKLDRIAPLAQAVTIITDDPDTAAAIAAHPAPFRALVEVDCGEHRGGMAATDSRLLEVAARLGPKLRGVLTHSGHSYAGRTPEDMAEIAETERRTIVEAAQRLQAAGHPSPVISMGSSPTLRHARHLEGVTEIRAGVYMFGDLFQAGIHTHGLADIALTVLASVIGIRAKEHRFIIDAGGIALSKDRSTQAGPRDYGFGLVLAPDGTPRFGNATIVSAYQEHGVVQCDTALPMPALRIGDLVRVAPNHTCMTAAAHDRYHVVDGGTEVLATWDRVNGW